MTRARVAPQKYNLSFWSEVHVKQVEMRISSQLLQLIRLSWTWSPESPCVSMNFSLSLLSAGGYCSDQQERGNANTWPSKREKMQARDQTRESEGVREAKKERVCLFQVVCTGHIQHVLCMCGWQSCSRATEVWRKNRNPDFSQPAGGLKHCSIWGVEGRGGIWLWAGSRQYHESTMVWRNVPLYHL